MVFNKVFLSIVFLLSIVKNDVSDKREKYTHEIVKNFAKKLQKKGLRPVGLGEGIDHDSGKQNYLGISSRVNNLPNIEFARKLIVETINQFLNEINSTIEVQPYLVESPFTINYIRISLLADDSTNGLVSVSNCENYLFYYIKNPDPFGEAWLEIHKETFGEAERILKNHDI